VMKMPVHSPINTMAGNQRRISRSTSKENFPIVMFITKSFLYVFKRYSVTPQVPSAAGAEMSGPDWKRA
jgi:hypothetical protein